MRGAIGLLRKPGCIGSAAASISGSIPNQGISPFSAALFSSSSGGGSGRGCGRGGPAPSPFQHVANQPENPKSNPESAVPTQSAAPTHEKMRPFLMAYENITGEEEWKEVVEDTMSRVPLIKEIVDHHAGPDTVTAKQQQKELKRVAKTLPASTPDSVKRFTDRAVKTLQSNPGWGFDKKCQFMDKHVLANPTLSSTPFLVKHFSSMSSKVAFTREGNFDENQSRTRRICPGCGVHMQDADSKQPGFFVKPSSKTSDYKLPISCTPVADEPQISDSLKKGFLPDLVDSPKPVVEKPVVCARCHSLRHYGMVKDTTVENLLPDFDFDHTVGRKLSIATGSRSVVLMVVDIADFDGSFPSKVANLLSRTIEENSRGWKEGKSGNVPRVVLVLTKLDLLPSSISPTRLEHWVRQRAREGGANKLTDLHMVSAVRDWGVKNLIDCVVELAGPRGNVWAIGAQNAGKSTLINAMGKHVLGKVTQLTEAPVPGTTLGIVRMEGVLPGIAKLFDTPGLLHPHQITTRLSRDEQKLLHIAKELKPRTYRIKAGHTVHIAGLMRVDIEESSVDTVYVTVWASPHLPLHMGKTETADRMLGDHFGRQLQPPIEEHRVKELGEWVKKEFHVTGNSWDSSSVDVAVGGLGWVAIGLKGEATLGVWTYDGIQVTLRNSLLPHRSWDFELAGFTVSKIVSQADQSFNKSRIQAEKRKRATTQPMPSVSAC